MGQVFSSKEPSVYGRSTEYYETLRTQITVLEDSLEIITKERNVAEGENKRLRIDSARIQNINVDYDKRLSELNAKEHALAVQNGQQKSELIQTQKSLKKLKTDKDDMERNLSNQCSELKKKLTLATSQISELTYLHDNLEKELADTQKQMELLKDENKVLESAVHAIDDVTDRLQDRLKTRDEIQDVPITSSPEV